MSTPPPSPDGQAKVVSIADVLAAPSEGRHGNCTKAVLHQSPASEASLFTVLPGQRLAAHSHTRSWDLFLALSGEGEIRFQGPYGEGVAPMSPNGFCAMPPGHAHEVCNRRQDAPFSFLLIHAPWAGYDFIKTGS